MITIRAIKSRKPFDSKVFRRELIAEAKEMGEFVKKDFEKTTRTWKHQPKFTVDVQVAAGTGVLLQVMTEDEIYQYVDEGTKPHIIRPKNKKALAFSSKFTPKTRPRMLKSYAGRTGKVDTVRKEVHHPGTKPREFTPTITDRWQPGFRRGIQNALNRAAEKSGHKI